MLVKLQMRHAKLKRSRIRWFRKLSPEQLAPSRALNKLGIRSRDLERILLGVSRQVSRFVSGVPKVPGAMLVDQPLLAKF